MTTIKYPELAYVNPNKLVRVLKLNNFGDEIKKEMFSSNGENQILGGDWDLNLSIPFEELDVFKSIQSHFIEGKNWNETRLYTRVSKVYFLNTVEKLRHNFRNILLDTNKKIIFRVK